MAAQFALSGRQAEMFSKLNDNIELMNKAILKMFGVKTDKTGTPTMSQDNKLAERFSKDNEKLRGLYPPEATRKKNKSIIDTMYTSITKNKFFQQTAKGIKDISSKLEGGFLKFIAFLFAMAIFDPKGTMLVSIIKQVSSILAMIVKYVVKLLPKMMKVLFNVVPMLIKTIAKEIIPLIGMIFKFIYEQIALLILTKFPKLAPKLLPVFKYIHKVIINLFSKNGPIVKFIGILADLLPFIAMGIGVFLLIKKIMPIILAIKGVFSILLLIPGPLLLIGGVILAIIAFVKYGDKLKKTASNFINKIPERIAWVAKHIGNFFMVTVPKIIKSIFKTIKSFFESNIIDDLRGTFWYVVEYIQHDIIPRIKKAIDSVVSTFQKKIIPGIKKFWATFKEETLPQIKLFFSNALDFLVDKALPTIQGWVDKALAWVVKGATSAGDGLTTFLLKYGPRLWKILIKSKKLIGTITSLGWTIFKKVAWGLIKGIIKGILRYIWNTFKNTVLSMFKMGGNVIGGAASKIGSAASNVAGKAGVAWESVKGWLKKNIIRGPVNAIKMATDRIKEFANEIWRIIFKPGYLRYLIFGRKGKGKISDILGVSSEAISTFSPKFKLAEEARSKEILYYEKKIKAGNFKEGEKHFLKSMLKIFKDSATEITAGVKAGMTLKKAKASVSARATTIFKGREAKRKR